MSRSDSRQRDMLGRHDGQPDGLLGKGRGCSQCRRKHGQEEAGEMHVDDVLLLMVTENEAV